MLKVSKRAACSLYFALACASGMTFADPGTASVCSDIPPAIASDKPLRLMMHVSSKGLHGDPTSTGLYFNSQPPPGVSPGANAAGIIIGALIIGGMNEAERRSVLQSRAKVKEMLARRDLEAEWREKLLRTAATQSWFAKSKVEHVTDPLDLEQPGLLVRITEETILTVDTRLLLQTDMSRVHAATTLRIWRKQDHVPLYCRQIVVISEAATSGNANEHWLANEGERLSQFVAEATDQTLWVFAMDGGAASKSATSGEVQVTLHDLMTGKPQPVKLSLMEDNDQRLVGRTKLNNQEFIISVPKWGANERSIK